MPSLRLGYKKVALVIRQRRLFCGAPRRIRTFDLPVRSRALYPLSYGRKFGASDGNRTHATSLEGWNSTIELHSHTIFNSLYMISQRFAFVNSFLKVFSSFLNIFCLWGAAKIPRPKENYFTTTFIIFPGTTISLITVFPSIAALIFSSAYTTLRVSSFDAPVGIITVALTFPLT